MASINLDHPLDICAYFCCNAEGCLRQIASLASKAYHCKLFVVVGKLALNNTHFREELLYCDCGTFLGWTDKESQNVVMKTSHLIIVGQSVVSVTLVNWKIFVNRAANYNYT